MVDKEPQLTSEDSFLQNSEFIGYSQRITAAADTYAVEQRETKPLASVSLLERLEEQWQGRQAEYMKWEQSKKAGWETERAEVKRSFGIEEAKADSLLQLFEMSEPAVLYWNDDSGKRYFYKQLQDKEIGDLARETDLATSVRRLVYLGYQVRANSIGHDTVHQVLGSLSEEAFTTTLQKLDPYVFLKAKDQRVTKQELDNEYPFWEETFIKGDVNPEQRRKLDWMLRVKQLRNDAYKPDVEYSLTIDTFLNPDNERVWKDAAFFVEALFDANPTNYGYNANMINETIRTKQIHFLAALARSGVASGHEPETRQFLQNVNLRMDRYLVNGKVTASAVLGEVERSGMLSFLPPKEKDYWQFITNLYFETGSFGGGEIPPRFYKEFLKKSETGDIPTQFREIWQDILKDEPIDSLFAVFDALSIAKVSHLEIQETISRDIVAAYALQRVTGRADIERTYPLLVGYLSSPHNFPKESPMRFLHGAIVRELPFQSAYTEIRDIAEHEIRKFDEKKLIWLQTAVHNYPSEQTLELLKLYDAFLTTGDFVPLQDALNKAPMDVIDRLNEAHVSERLSAGDRDALLPTQEPTRRLIPLLESYLHPDFSLSLKSLEDIKTSLPEEEYQRLFTYLRQIQELNDGKQAVSLAQQAGTIRQKINTLMIDATPEKRLALITIDRQLELAGSAIFGKAVDVVSDTLNVAKNEVLGPGVDIQKILLSLRDFLSTSGINPSNDERLENVSLETTATSHDFITDMKSAKRLVSDLSQGYVGSLQAIEKLLFPAVYRVIAQKEAGKKSSDEMRADAYNMSYAKPPKVGNTI